MRGEAPVDMDNEFWKAYYSWLHMLRGMAAARWGYPFASVDSTDIARNHNRPQNTARGMADIWDAIQCPARWEAVPTQQLLEIA